jgi:hypothetical protein
MLGHADGEVYLERARVKEAADDEEGAAADRARAAELGCVDDDDEGEGEGEENNG